MTSWAGRRVLVVGLGASGLAAARALLDLGARVCVTESRCSDELLRRADELCARGAQVELGGHDPRAWDAEVAVLSPGIPPHAPVRRAISQLGLEEVGEVELAAGLARCDLLAVTGTNGKTTTTSLLAAILAEEGIPTAAAGNIGVPLVEAVGAIPEGGALAVEVSSFQLEATRAFRPRVAVVLNVAEDHTDWHGSFESYVRAKARIVANQRADDFVVYNDADAHARAIADEATSRPVPFSAARALREGIGVSDGVIRWRAAEVMPVAEVPLPGAGGVDDVLAAAGAALAYGVDTGSVRRAVRAFRPLPHRMRIVAERDGVTYIDDSKATNPHATLAAVRSLRDVVLIAGGRAKGVDLGALSGAVPPVSAVVALGESADTVAEVFDGLVPVAVVATMEQAVDVAREHAVRGGSVLLSPACASLDMYEGYAARGDDFERAVRAALDDDDGTGHGHA
ncbi:MAG TPA: UDP-N-acetylmuramoyl-L-alanine--D-glutamate ligase [Actinomycetota bacterium]|nr:UDP-N-acetylmuramoyl-L-alanine--D-glutamate ligase [Actinomycetota bacterium]